MLSLLQAAPNMAEIPAKPPVSCTVSPASGKFTLNVGKTHQLEFRAANSPVAPIDDLSAVKEIEILGIIPTPAARGKQR